MAMARQIATVPRVKEKQSALIAETEISQADT